MKYIMKCNTVTVFRFYCLKIGQELALAVTTQGGGHLETDTRIQIQVGGSRQTTYHSGTERIRFFQKLCTTVCNVQV